MNPAEIFKKADQAERKFLSMLEENTKTLSTKKRHRWSGRVGTSRDDMVVACVNCGMVKQRVKGKLTYFKDDCVYMFASECKPENTNP